MASRFIKLSSRALEILSAVYATQRRPLDRVSQIARRLDVSEGQVKRSLDALMKRGLVSVDSFDSDWLVSPHHSADLGKFDFDRFGDVLSVRK